MALAKPVVLAVVTAREHGNAADAALLLNAYQQEAKELGSSSGTAWAILFSASTLWVAGLIELHAREHEQETLKSLQMLALAFAGADVNG